MRIRLAGFIAFLLSGLLVIGLVISAGCSSQSSNGNPSQSIPSQSGSASVPSATQPPVETGSPKITTNPVSVVVAGYINHGPLQPTVQAIKGVLAKYDDKVTVTWIDLATAEGQTYFQAHGLTAHMNVIINGTSKYQVDGKTVDFEWFEGQQWTREELDEVLANLINK